MTHIDHAGATSGRGSGRRSLVVTGGARGIGREVALAAADRRWFVTVGYRDRAADADATLAEVHARGGDGIAVAGDVAREDDVVRLFDAAAAHAGGIDAVVVNAGIVAPAMPLAAMGVERLRRVFDVNVLGAYLTAREAARRMPRSAGGRGGAIVLVSSAAARLGAPSEYVDYAGSKGAIDTLTIGLAKELARDGVRVNAVRPGLIDTEIHADSGDPARAERLGATTPLGRPGTAAEVAAAILWLLDDPASYCTGTIVDVAGGR